MCDSLAEARKRQALSVHVETLGRMGYTSLEDRAGEYRRLHDLYDGQRSTWIECKTDESKFTSRLLLEWKANVPEALLPNVPQRRGLNYSLYAPRFVGLPEQYKATLMDRENLEPQHLLSYLWRKSGAVSVYDLRALRRRVWERRWECDFFICGSEAESWRTIALLVPTSYVEDLDLLAQARGYRA